jgi:K+-transporting ATPase ATPase B chain
VDFVPGTDLRKGDVVLVEAGDMIPADGEVIEGVASVNESAITGESAPVIREAGGDFSAVTGGTTVLSDWIVVRVTVNPGETFLDRMIALVEGAKRQKTPNEIALTILLVALTLVFLLATVTLLPYSLFSVETAKAGQPVTITALVALLVCLIPTTIGALLSAIGIAGMSRMLGANVIATSGRAVEAAGDVDVLLLDKTGTITLGNRQAAAFLPVRGVPEQELADSAQLASLADETPEGRSVVVLAKQRFNLRERDIHALGATFVPFSAQTRMSGVNFDGRQIRKGAGDAIRNLVESNGGTFPKEVAQLVDDVSRRGSTPLVVADGKRVLGVIELKDIVKGGIKERFAELRRMGIKTVMITGDNRLTAAAIAAEAGVDDFLPEATPEAKLALIRKYQAEGRLVAMTGDGTNDAPALAQADVAVAMHSGTQAAKEAGNMVDLDSNPTKLLEVVAVGKQMLMTRGALTTFSIANDLAKYFAIIPAMFVAIYPQLDALNVMGLASPQSAILAAVIFNALIIVALIPLALKGIRYRPQGAGVVLRRNLAIYGLGGILVPFIGIKLIDLGLAAVGLV